MWTLCSRWCAGLVLAVCAIPVTAVAQIDYRNLDAGRPVRSEDAYSIDRYAFEFLVPYRFEQNAGGVGVHRLLPELEYGLFSDTHVGASLPVGLVGNDGTTTGVGAPIIFALHNFNTETSSLPAFALRVDAQLPVGTAPARSTRVTATAIATRSWGRNRVHLNAAWGFGANQLGAPLDEPIRWAASVAVDRTLYRQSILAVAELSTLRSPGVGPAEVNVGAGIRWQWTPTLVLDIGVARRLRRDVGPDIGLTIGLSHTFAFAGLMPAPTRRGAR